MVLDDKEKKRRRMVLAGLLVLAAAYVLICEFTPLRIPCVFHEVTGLDCPGCGITRMCMSLVHFDIAGAYAYNGLALVTLPLLVYIAGSAAYGYAGGKIPERASKANTAIAVALIAAFLVFGVLRNIV